MHAYHLKTEAFCSFSSSVHGCYSQLNYAKIQYQLPRNHIGKQTSKDLPRSHGIYSRRSSFQEYH